MSSPPKERRPRSIRPDQGGHLANLRVIWYLTMRGGFLGGWRRLREAATGGQVCAVCYGYFTPEDWDNRHTDSNGEDTHASCCTVDERPHTDGANR